MDFTPNIPQPSEQNFIIELVDKIPDPNLQKEYFKKYLEIQNKIVKNNWKYKSIQPKNCIKTIL